MFNFKLAGFIPLFSKSYNLDPIQFLRVNYKQGHLENSILTIEDQEFGRHAKRYHNLKCMSSRL